MGRAAVEGGASPRRLYAGSAGFQPAMPNAAGTAALRQAGLLMKSPSRQSGRYAGFPFKLGVHRAELG